VKDALAELAAHYEERGVQLVERGKRWHFQTAPDLAHLLRREREESRRLSRAATEVLAIVAYHEPVSRAEIEAIRGVQTAKGTLDVLMEAGWVRIVGRREVPGRPVIYATTPDFLTHFGSKAAVICRESTNCAPPGCLIRLRKRWRRRWTCPSRRTDRK
jgi:segregation and condensation protein B